MAAVTVTQKADQNNTGDNSVKKEEDKKNEAIEAKPEKWRLSNLREGYGHDQITGTETEHPANNIFRQIGQIERAVKAEFNPFGQSDSRDGKNSQNGRFRGLFAPGDVDMAINEVLIEAALKSERGSRMLNQNDISEALSAFRENPGQLNVFDRSLGLKQRLEALNALLAAAEARSQNIAPEGIETVQVSATVADGATEVAGKPQPAASQAGPSATAQKDELDSLKRAVQSLA